MLANWIDGSYSFAFGNIGIYLDVSDMVSIIAGPEGSLLICDIFVS